MLLSTQEVSVHFTVPYKKLIYQSFFSTSCKHFLAQRKRISCCGMVVQACIRKHRPDLNSCFLVTKRPRSERLLLMSMNLEHHQSVNHTQECIMATSLAPGAWGTWGSTFPLPLFEIGASHFTSKPTLTYNIE